MTTLRDIVMRGIHDYESRPFLVNERGDVSTFGALGARAAHLSAVISSRTTIAHPLVAVCLERSDDLYAGIAAALLAGGAYMPISTSEPPARLQSIVERSRPSMVITTEAIASRFLALDVPILIADRIAGEPDAVRAAAPGGRDAAYVIFTSGSTGEPKGAVIPNRAIVNRLLWMTHALKVTSDDVLIQKTPVTFDVSVWELFLPYLTGASLVIPRPDGHRDVGYVADLIRQHAVTMIHFVPSALSPFLNLPSVTENSRSLRLAILSGEAMSVELRDRALRALPTAELYNLYGPTEAAVDVSWWRCSATDTYDTVPIGRPIDNVDLYVLDENMVRVSPGTRGELYIGGIAVGDGYLNDPEKTGQYFVPDTIRGEPGAVMYRTGDIVVESAGGVLEYIGRRDFQVKVRGNRIELGEVEAAVRASAPVSECVAMPSVDAGGETILSAWVVPANGDSFSDAECRAAMRNFVPDYMIPSVFVVMAELPLTTHGKVDRSRLPMPDWSPKISEPSRSGTDLISAVSRIWCDVLGRDTIASDVNFFDAGGTSLSILRLPNLIRDRIGATVGVVELFDNPTVADLAALIEGRLR